MADQAELHATIARLEAAMGALTKRLESHESAEQAAMLEAAATRLEEAQAEAASANVALQAAEARIADLEAAAASAPDIAPTVEGAASEGAPEEVNTRKLRLALDELSASSDALRGGADGAVDASLRAEVDALRAARALDLAEMRAILEELEPMMETTHA